MDIQGNTFIVTGGASGLGEATVRRIVENGGRAVLFDITEQAGESLARELGDRAIYCPVDVTGETDVQKGIQLAVEHFGSLDGVVNCAGVVAPGKVFGKQGPMPLETFNKTVQINLVGTFNVIRLAAVQMAENARNEDGERGVIINTASIAAYEGQIGQAAYSASKAGVAGMTLTLAREFADYGLRVVSIAPGLFDTSMIASLPEKVRHSMASQLIFPPRFGKPEEFAQMVQCILSIPFLNGETIRLDSGMRMNAK